jgi:hypothetical protein
VWGCVPKDDYDRVEQRERRQDGVLESEGLGMRWMARMAAIVFAAFPLMRGKGNVQEVWGMHQLGESSEPGAVVDCY